MLKMRLKKAMDLTVEFFKKLNRISSRDDVIYFYINGKESWFVGVMVVLRSWLMLLTALF